MESAVNTAIAATGASGAIVGVWVPWSGSWVTGLGTVKTGSQQAVTTDMSFRIGAVTREMTCDALAGMVADGLVAYGDDVADYVPGIRTDTPVTLKQLCDGTAGWAPISAAVQAEFLANPERVWEPRELASFGFGAPPVGAPGEKYVDTEAGYLLLGLALERASDMTAPQYIRHYVTEPLGLQNTALPSVKAAAPQPTPHLIGQYSYTDADGVVACDAPTNVSVMSSSTGFTDSGATSTIEDLGRYAAALAAGSLRQKGQSDRFADAVPVAEGAPSWFNAGGGSIIAGGLVGQGGQVPGYATAAFSDPKTGMTIAVVLNSSTGDPAAARNLALQLSAIASKTPAASGQTAPEFGLPWTAEAYASSITKHAKCPLPAE